MTSYDKIALKKLIIDQDEYLFNKLDKSFFYKSRQKVFTAIEKFYDKYKKLPTKDELEAFILQKVPKEKAELYISIINGVITIKENTSIDELLNHLKEERANRIVESYLEDLVEASNNKDVEQVKIILQKINQTMDEIDDKTPKDITETHFKGEGLATIPVCLPSMQKEGLSLAGLTIVGSGSGMGKSVFSLQQAVYTYQLGYKVGIMSLELPEAQVKMRLYSMVNEVPFKDLQKEDPSKLAEKIDKWVEEYFGKDKFFISATRYNVYEIEKYVMYLIKRGVKLIVIDYLNLVESVKSEEEWKTLSALVKKLHDIAVHNNVVILSPTQINISESKKGKIEVSTRGSKELEFSASVFLLIHQTKEEYKENVARIVVRKSRVSRKFTALTQTKFDVMKFEDTGMILEEV